MVCNKTSPDEIAEALGREFARHAALHDREASFPFENFDRITASGLAALTVPHEYGGRGAGLFETCAVVGAMARGDASTALVLTMQVERAIALVGNPGLRRQNPLERHYRDVLCSRVHTPQNDSILLNAGRAAFAAISN